MFSFRDYFGSALSQLCAGSITLLLACKQNDNEIQKQLISIAPYNLVDNSYEDSIYLYLQKSDSTYNYTYFNYPIDTAFLVAHETIRSLGDLYLTFNPKDYSLEFNEIDNCKLIETVENGLGHQLLKYYCDDPNVIDEELVLWFTANLGIVAIQSINWQYTMCYIHEDLNSLKLIKGNSLDFMPKPIE